MKARLLIDNASPEKSCFVVDLVCFISPCTQADVSLNATRTEAYIYRNRRKSGSMQFVKAKEGGS